MMGWIKNVHLEHLVNVVVGVRGVKPYGLAQPFVAWPHSWLHSGSSTLFFTTSNNLQTSSFCLAPILQHCQDWGWQSCTWMLWLPEERNNRLETEKALASDQRHGRLHACVCRAARNRVTWQWDGLGRNIAVCILLLPPKPWCHIPSLSACQWLRLQ